MNRRSTYILFFIFAISGFSGLIYESIWTHYLKLFLGHAAYAQTLVLAIFMGGMALGSWICSKYTLRWKNLLAGYALTEGMIGLFALVFHTIFDQAVQFSYASVIPYLGSAVGAHAYKWVLSALLILPQSILLGMTFPLMAAGIIRLSSNNKGKTIALLYFTNSLGAAIGVLASGFILIRLIGLPWTIRAAGLINLALALFVWSFAKKQDDSSTAVDAESGILHEQTDNGRYLLLLVALFTGTASFIYEIGWIRMLSLVMGSSTHAFELMLSAFILGLALGGLWIQRRIDRIAIPERFLAYVQIAMGLLALVTLPLYGRMFDVMRLLLKTLDKTDNGYLLYNLSGSAIALAVMLPATFCAGMTLPLITYTLIRREQEERSIGAVYAVNTVGAIIGVFFATHVGMPILGLKGLITFGAACDLALGAILLWFAAGYASMRRPAIITTVSFCAVAATLSLVNLDPYKMASGVYRTGMLLYPQLTDVLFNKDGKTATISVSRDKVGGVVTIATNGKPDASVGMAPASQATSDEATMILAAALPMAFNPAATTVANIGLGSGLTTHTLLGNPRLKRVDTVEIEKAVLDGEKFFRPRVSRAYDDPRSKIFIDDAKTFFSVNNKQYEIIISEPSNPWVSGVSGLFSKEFYHQINQHLSKDGLFAQWVQLYEIDTDLVLSILKAVSNSFSDYAVYATNDQDLLIIAKKQGVLPALEAQVFNMPEISVALNKIKIHGIQDFEVRKIGNKKFFRKLLAMPVIRANSDYFPVVDQNAARTRFLQTNAFNITNLSLGPVPALEMLTGSAPLWHATDVTLSSLYSNSQFTYSAMALRDYYQQGQFGPGSKDVPQEVQQMAVQFRQIFYDCRADMDQTSRQISLYNGLINVVPYLRPQELAPVWKQLQSGRCTESFSMIEKNWIALFKAISERNAAAMTNGAKSILLSGQQLPPAVMEFVVSSGMLGSLMQGDRKEAYRFWSSLRAGISTDSQAVLLLRLLAAESTMPD